MAERVTLQWNVTNWITVVLMAAIGTALLGCFVSGFGMAKDANSDKSY